jgi:predicted aspartyl protease
LLFFPAFCWDRGEYGAGLKMLDIIEASLGDRQSLKEETEKLKERCRAMSEAPKPEILIPDGDDSVRVAIRTEPLITFEARYNRTVLRTVFDTGAGYPFFTQKKMAEKAGISILTPYSENAVNGTQLPSAYGIIDSVRIGRLLIKNAPVFVLEDGYFDRCTTDSARLSERDAVTGVMEIVMGLPIIRMLHHIRFDFPECEMVISFRRRTEGGENGHSNMYIESDALYVQAGMNGQDFTAFMDTGGHLGDLAVIVSARYYRNHAERLSPEPSGTEETQDQCGVGGADRFTFFRPGVLTMQLGSCAADFTNETAILTDDTLFHPLSKDGYIGLGWLKKLERTTFDFKAMRIAAND